MDLENESPCLGFLLCLFEENNDHDAFTTTDTISLENKSSPV